MTEILQPEMPAVGDLVTLRCRPAIYMVVVARHHMSLDGPAISVQWLDANGQLQSLRAPLVAFDLWTSVFDLDDEGHARETLQNVKLQRMSETLKAGGTGVKQ